MRRFSHIFFCIVFFVLTVWMISDPAYASNADCLNAYPGRSACVSAGTCRGFEGSQIDYSIACNVSYQVCCVGQALDRSTQCTLNGSVCTGTPCSENPPPYTAISRDPAFCTAISSGPLGINRVTSFCCSFGGWGSCSTPYGGGTCQDRNNQGCSGDYIPGYCPGGANIQCCVPNPRYSISGTVFVDNNRNGVQDGGEPGYGGLGVSGPASTTTNGSGNYTLSGILRGSYTISISVPANHVATTPTSRNVTIGPNRSGINFGIVPVYSISGSVFNDVDRDYARDAGEGKTWSGTVSFSTTGGNLSTDSGAGTFSITNLYAGTYTVRLTSGIPSGFINRHPVNGPPPAFSVTVGSGCTFSPQHPNAAGRAACSARGDMSNLNFVITNSIPWFQTYGFDVRIDNGITNIIPASPTYPGFMSVVDTLN